MHSFDHHGHTSVSFALEKVAASQVRLEQLLMDSHKSIIDRQTDSEERILSLLGAVVAPDGTAEVHRGSSCGLSRKLLGHEESYTVLKTSQGMTAHSRRSQLMSPTAQSINEVVQIVPSGSEDAPARSSLGDEMSCAETHDIARTLSKELSSPRAWPENIELRHELGLRFTATRRRNTVQVDQELREAIQHAKVEAAPTGVSLGFSKGLTKEVRRRVVPMQPNSNLRLGIDIWSLFVLGYAVITVPYVLAFDVQITGFIEAANILAAVWWTIDIALSFNTGFYEGVDRDLQMSRAAITQHFLQTWFAFDVSLVISDWISILIDKADVSVLGRARSVSRWLMAGRFVRLFRMARQDLFFVKEDDLEVFPLVRGHHVHQPCAVLCLVCRWQVSSHRHWWQVD